MRSTLLLLLISVCFPAIPALQAQDLPYFVTYSHHLEEPGSLEIETKSATGRPDNSGRFAATALEFEYGARAWWTSEVYLDGQTTAKDSTVFTGFRFENRFRPMFTERWINPVLYFEFEDINGADKTLLEVVGHDGAADLATENRIARLERKRETELKLILSSNTRGWNISENFIAEKNLKHAPWEFGYAVATSRPLHLAGSPHPHAYSLTNFQVGAEAYGGLGDTDAATLRDTSHYLGPVVKWSSPSGMTLSFNPSFGLTDGSLPRLYRVGVSYEVGQLSRLWRGNR